VSLFGTGRREDFLACAALVLLALVTHFPGLFLGKARLAVDPALVAADASHSAALAGEAATNQTTVLPTWAAAAEVVRQGEWPTWNERARFGEPFAAARAGIWYPGFWPLLLGLHPALAWVMWLHTVLACVAMFRFLRCIALSRYAAFLGGGMYGLGWFLSAQLDRLPEAAACALLPVALELTWRMTYSHRRTAPAVGLGFVIALIVATDARGCAGAGLTLCGAVFCAGLMFKAYRRRGPVMMAGLTAGAIACALAAPVLLERAQNAPALVDVGPPDRVGLRPAGLVAALAPGVAGRSLADVPAAVRSLSPEADPIELVLFPGSLVLAFLLLGLLRMKRWRGLVGWLAAGVLGLALSVQGPIPDALRAWSGLGAGPAGAWLVLTHLCAIVLACAAFDGFLEAPQRRRFAAGLTPVLCLGLAGAGVTAGYVQPRLGASLMASACPEADASEVAEGVRHLAAAYLPTALALAAVAAAFLLWHRLGIRRFKVTIAAIGLLELVLAACQTAWFPAPTASTGVAGMLPAGAGRVLVAADTPVSAAAEAALGTAGLVTHGGRLALARSVEALRQVDARIADGAAPLRGAASRAAFAHPLLAAAAVDTAIASADLPLETFAPLAAAPPGPGCTARVHVLQRLAPVQRIRVASDPLVVDAPSADVLRRNPAAAVERGVIEDARGFTCKSSARPPLCAVERTHGQEIRAQVDMGDGRGYLLAADAYAPGWRAFVDGEATPIAPANIAFRAVAVPEGRHEVRFVYRPWSTTLGIPLACLGLALVLLITLWPLLARAGREA
jgi:hypothetical protein